jgi:hypothetical protein
MATSVLWIACHNTRYRTTLDLVDAPSTGKPKPYRHYHQHPRKGLFAERACAYDVLPKLIDNDIDREGIAGVKGSIVGAILIRPSTQYEGVLTKLNDEQRHLYDFYARPDNSFYFEIVDAFFLPEPLPCRFAEFVTAALSFKRYRFLVQGRVWVARRSEMGPLPSKGRNKEGPVTVGRARSRPGLCLS